MKVVQTEVPEELHKKIVELSKKRGVPIKKLVREALEEWVAWSGDLSDDPLLNLEPVDFGVETDAEKLETTRSRRVLRLSL